ncbi:energy-coupling factor transporter ATPase [Zongyangia hominis]|uniref:Energy-coupling factor transporter ATP-binding protein EcfA2 n=1 Tax=Zongyangia hominis TaxID=2763677 RepID=A0A926IAI2_9FIRM|nr:energy-coupling factor transporter ATPase [Zongyangia hominis]MBC8569223.1 energy-coupling factor transporter ATPase [Zongyangia hominis]
MSVIKTEHLTYTYNGGSPFEKVAVDDVNLEIEQGELVGIIGHTGSGKSTLIQHFNGLVKPTAGKVYIDGRDIWENPKDIRRIRFQVGLVFQYPEYQLFEETVYKDIAYGPTNIGLSKEEIDERVREAAMFVGLRESTLEKSPFELSGGQKRRVAIAGVIAMRPEVLILDEPTAGLDPKGRDKILGQIKQYHEAQKNTVLIVSHSMEDVAKYCQKALVMNQSKVFLYDTIENVFSHTEELSAMGLAVPQVTRIFHALGARGVEVNPDIFTVEAGREELLKLLAAHHVRKGGAARA